MNFEERVFYYTLRGFLDNVFYPLEDVIKNERKRIKGHMAYDVRRLTATPLSEVVKDKIGDYEF